MTIEQDNSNQTETAWVLWDNFTKITTWAVSSIVIALLLMAVFLL